MKNKSTMSQLSRRQFIKRSGGLATAMAFPAIMTSRKALAEPTEINMLAWYRTR